MENKKVNCENCKFSKWKDKENAYECKYANFVGTNECKAVFEMKN